MNNIHTPQNQTLTKFYEFLHNDRLFYVSARSTDAHKMLSRLYTSGFSRSLRFEFGPHHTDIVENCKANLGMVVEPCPAGFVFDEWVNLLIEGPKYPLTGRKYERHDYQYYKHPFHPYTCGYKGDDLKYILHLFRMYGHADYATIDRHLDPNFKHVHNFRDLQPIMLSPIARMMMIRFPKDILSLAMFAS